MIARYKACRSQARVFHPGSMARRALFGGFTFYFADSGLAGNPRGLDVAPVTV